MRTSKCECEGVRRCKHGIGLRTSDWPQVLVHLFVSLCTPACPELLWVQGYVVFQTA